MYGPTDAWTKKASHAWTTPVRPARLTMTPRIAPPTPATKAHGLCDRPERSTRRAEPVEAAAEAPLDLRIVLTRLPAVRRRFKRCACGGSTPMAVRTGGARRPDARTRSSGSMLIPMDLGTDVTRRLCVRSRIRQLIALPMDLGTVVSVRPDVRGRFRQSMALPMDLKTVMTSRWHSQSSVRPKPVAPLYGAGFRGRGCAPTALGSVVPGPRSDGRDPDRPEGAARSSLLLNGACASDRGTPLRRYVGQIRPG